MKQLVLIKMADLVGKLYEIRESLDGGFRTLLHRALHIFHPSSCSCPSEWLRSMVLADLSLDLLALPHGVGMYIKFDGDTVLLTLEGCKANCTADCGRFHSD